MSKQQAEIDRDFICIDELEPKDILMWEGKTFVRKNIVIQAYNVPDKLDEIMHDQSKFTDEIYDKYKGQPFSCFNFKEEYFKIWYSLMRAGSEIHEAAELVPSKLWKEVPPDFVLDRTKVLEEIIDAQKFINQAVQVLGYDSKEVFKMHMLKSKVNRKRQKDGYKY